MKTIDRTGSAVVTLPSDLEIKIVRHFDAPAGPRRSTSGTGGATPSIP
jgi:hypothetical protein